MEDQILSPHFRLSEFTRSATAERYHIDNTIPDDFVPNLKLLCAEVLEPLRQHFGTPIIVSSGYRCPELNHRVGGVPNSQHQFGEAADIYNSSIIVLCNWFLWLKKQFPQHQILFEKAKGKTWIHIGYKRK